MNFIFSVIFFIIFATISFFISTKLPSEYSTASMIPGIILSIVAFLFIIIGFFQNIDMRESQKREISRIKLYKNNINIKKSLIDTYKKEVENSLTKLYPDYEKEMFKTMSPNDAEALTVFLTKYPELKFNGVLQTFTNNITKMLNDVNESERQLEDIYESLRTRNGSSWFLIKVPIPDEAK